MPPKEEWLDELAAVAADLGHRPTKAEFSERASVTAEAFYRYYDGWSDVLDTAADHSGEPALSEPRETTPTGGENRIPTADLLADLRAGRQALGKIPSEPEYNGMGEYSARTIKNRFGSWYDALVAAFGDDVPESRRKTRRSK